MKKRNSNMISIENDDLVLDDSEVVDLIFEVSIDDEQVLIFEIFEICFDECLDDLVFDEEDLESLLSERPWKNIFLLLLKRLICELKRKLPIQEM
jgi:hypothetical protein